VLEYVFVAGHDGRAGSPGQMPPSGLMTLTPVPESVMVSGEFVALPATFTLPVTLPVAEGLNVAVNVAVCPALQYQSRWERRWRKSPRRIGFDTRNRDSRSPSIGQRNSLLLLLDTFTLPKLNADELELRIRVPEVIVEGSWIAGYAACAVTHRNAERRARGCRRSYVGRRKVAPLIAVVPFFH